MLIPSPFDAGEGEGDLPTVSDGVYHAAQQGVDEGDKELQLGCSCTLELTHLRVLHTETYLNRISPPPVCLGYVLYLCSALLR